MKRLSAIVISCCDETEMKSKKSKYSHTMCGKRIIDWVFEAIRESGIKNITEEFKPEIFLSKKGGNTIVIPGDMPLLSSETIKKIIKEHTENENAVTNARTKFGNTGLYCFANESLPEVGIELVENDMPEQTIKNIVEKLTHDGAKIGIMNIDDDGEVLRINNRVQLNTAETAMRRRIAERHMKNGVTIINPEATYIDDNVKIGMDTTILPGCTLKGKTVIGENCTIGPNSRIVDSVVNDSVEINNSEVFESFIDSDSNIGPFSYLRPDSRIGKKVKIGNYVEVKNSTIGDNTMVSHLVYVGDADIGESVNIGCGAVFVNFNGKAKYRSVVEKNAFIGCNVNIVAPVTIRENAFIAAGSTITDDVPCNSLAIARQRQIIKENWATKKD